MMAVLAVLQSSEPVPHHIMHVMIRWEKEARVAEQQRQQQLMIQEDDDDDNRNIAEM